MRDCWWVRKNLSEAGMGRFLKILPSTRADMSGSPFRV